MKTNSSHLKNRFPQWMITIFFVFTITLSCQSSRSQSNPDSPQSVQSNAQTQTKISIQDYLDPLLADGFDFPFGDKNGGGTYTDSSGKTHRGWYIATKMAKEYSLGIHPGEDWNGNGGGNTDLGQPIYATAKGIVLHAENYSSPWGKTVVIEHRYIENAHIKKVYSVYAHLDKMLVKKGETLNRGQKLGTIGTGEGAHLAHLHFEMRKPSIASYEPTYWPSSHGRSVEWVKEHYYVPSKFIKQHRKTPIPSKIKKMIVAVKHQYKIYLLKNGKIYKEHDMALSQSPLGHKQKEGDNKLPEGAYKIIQKSKAPFGGSYAAYFGPRWMRISYPNVYDAKAGLKRKVISEAQYKQIKAAHAKGSEPNKHTALGGGIGIHGWNGDWPENSKHLTWGCISMRNQDLPKFYDEVDLQTPIYIVP